VHSALVLSSVSKAFGDVQAIDHLDVEVPVGSVTVILGPNGAGKTTTIRLSTGVLAPDRGSVRTFGLDPRVSGAEVRRRTGVVPPKPAMYDRLSGWDNLAYAARLYGLVNPPIADLADRFGILTALGQTVGGYSTGMRTRLALARSLLHDPELLLLDEPTAGLDPESAYAVRELIFDMARAGKTVVMSTHLLHEADGTADQIVMMNGGSAWEKGSPAELTGRYWKRLEVRLEAEDPGALLAAVADMQPRVDELRAVTVPLNDSSEIPSLIGHLVAGGVRLTRVEPVTPTLERLYFAMRKQLGDTAPRLDTEERG
jgi:ABC-2 type transport system ATP-binding protein